MFKKKSLLFIFTALFTTTVASHISNITASGTCVKYPINATCSEYINYDILLPSSIKLQTIESSLQSSLKQLDINQPDCLDAYSRYLCSKTYPACQNTITYKTNVTTDCLSNCKKVNNVCSNIFKTAGQTYLLPNCTSKATCISTQMSQDTINRKRLNILAAPSSTELVKDCPFPFVKDTLASLGDGQTTDKKFCLLGCCTPCPLQNFIYKKGWAEKGFNTSNALRFVSAILSFFLVVSYLVLPDKRRHPSLLILNLSIGIFLFSMTSFFAIGNLKRVQCASNGVSPGEMDNNKLCAAQGAILVFGSFATAFWCSALILNLHLHTVWNYGFFTNRYVLLNTICWGIPTAITCIAIGLHAIKFEVASLCLVSMEYIFKLFFYPLAAIIIPSFLVHIATFFYIAHIAIREGLQSDMTQSLSAGNHPDRQPAVNHRHIMAAVQIQWRALMLAVAAIVTVLFYWLAYLTQMSRITQILDNASFTATWIHCMLTPEMDQDTCYDLIKSSLPSFPLMLSADILAGLIGFWLFILFAKRSLWREWNDLIYDIRLTLTGSKFKKNREQFFTL